MSDTPVLKSYVWHDGKCFFVSTIERDSSAVLDSSRFNETIIWDYDYEKRERRDMIGQESAPKGQIYMHQKVVEALYRDGNLKSLEAE